MLVFLYGQDYQLVPPSDGEVGDKYKLLTGPYAGTVFRYGGIKFEERNDQLHLLFNYNVIDSDKKKGLFSAKKKNPLDSDAEFKNYIGDLLYQMLCEKFETEIIDENGTDNTEEPSL